MMTGCARHRIESTADPGYCARAPAHPRANEVLRMRRPFFAAFAALAAATVIGGIGLAGTGADPSGTVIQNGRKVFPIVLAKGPDPGTKTPTGGDAFGEVAATGVTFLKIGPATTPWTDGDIADAQAQNA